MSSRSRTGRIEPSRRLRRPVSALPCFGPGPWPAIQMPTRRQPSAGSDRPPPGPPRHKKTAPVVSSACVEREGPSALRGRVDPSSAAAVLPLRRVQAAPVGPGCNLRFWLRRAHLGEELVDLGAHPLAPHQARPARTGRNRSRPLGLACRSGKSATSQGDLARRRLARDDERGNESGVEPRQRQPPVLPNPETDIADHEINKQRGKSGRGGNVVADGRSDRLH